MGRGILSRQVDSSTFLIEKEILNMFVPEEENVIVEDNTPDYINEIQRLKETTVSKEDYNKLKADNKKLITALSNGTTIEGKVEPKVSPVEKIQNLRKELFGSESNSMNDLDMVSKMLELRKEIIDNGGTDPFLPKGHKVRITDNDKECANRVARVLTECVEDAEGSNRRFMSNVFESIV